MVDYLKNESENSNKKHKQDRRLNVLVKTVNKIDISALTFYAKT